MVGSCDDKGKSCLHLHTIFSGQCLERHITLIVVHRQDTVEVVLIGITEEVIGDKGTVGLYTSLLKRRNGWGNDILLFRARLGIQGQYGDARILNTEVTLQCRMENGGLLDDTLFSDGA